MIFYPGDNVKFIYDGEKDKDDLFKSKIKFTVEKVYKHYVLCRSEKGYREGFFREEIRRV